MRMLQESNDVCSQGNVVHSVSRVVLRISKFSFLNYSVTELERARSVAQKTQPVTSEKEANLFFQCADLVCNYACTLLIASFVLTGWFFEVS